MADESLVARAARLEQLVSQRRPVAAARCTAAKTAGSAASLRALQQLAGRDALLDTLLALYDECNKDGLKQNPLVANFVTKFRGVVSELRRLRVGPADFEVHKTIGRGHFGQVHVVRERRTGDVFAMKTLRKQDTLAQSGVMFYEEERDIMTEATSPWITALHYAFQDAQQLYLVMDFHPGGDLMMLLDRFDGVLDEKTSRFYLAEIALALHDLHNMGYVHRDVKPENILLDRCGHAKLADFGSAARLGANGKVTAGMPVGTPDYLAPEVLRAINSGTGAARHGAAAAAYGTDCDYWSLGVVAFEMMTGNTPFSDEKLGSTYNNILEHKKHLRRPSEPAVSEAAWSLVSGLLADNNRRLGHAEVVQHAFFTAIDWNNIANTVPPFIPTVNGVDDTSNFDEVTPEPPSPSLDSLLSQQQFSGRELPFIGFTFTKPPAEPRLSKDRQRSSSLLPAAGPDAAAASELERKVSAQRRQLHTLRERLEQFERGDVGNQVKQLSAKLDEKNERLQRTEEERTRLETALAKAEDKSAGYVRLLEMEKKDRMSTEKRALELLQDIKRKWKRDEEERLKVVHDEVKRYQTESKSLEEKYHFALENLQRCQSQLTAAEEARRAAEEASRHNKHKVKEVLDSSRQDSAGLQQRLDQLTATSQQQQRELEQQRAAQQRLQQQLSDAEDERRRLQRQLERARDEAAPVAELRADRDRLRAETERLARGCREAEARAERCQQGGSQTAAQLERQLAELRRQLAEQAEQLKVGTTARRLQGESEAALASRESELSSERASHQAETAELQTRLREGNEERERLLEELMATQDKEVDHQQRICELETTLLGLEQSLTKLEHRNESLQHQLTSTSAAAAAEEQLDSEELARLRQQQAVLQTQLERAESQLETVRERAAVDRHKVAELQDQIRLKDKQLNDWKIDVRIANREARTAETALTALRESESGWAAERAELTQRAAQLEVQLAERQAELERARRELERAGGESDELKAAHETEISRWVEQVRSLERELADGAAVAAERQQAERSAQQLQERLEQERAAVRREQERSARLESQADELRGELAEARKQTAAHEATIASLKELCSTLDNQLTDMEELLNKQETDSQKHEQNKASLSEEIVRLQAEVRAAKASANEEKSLKMFQERRAQDLERRLQAQETEVETERDILRKDLEEYRELSRGLTDQLSQHDQQLSEAQTQLRQLERREEQTLNELSRLKEEMSGLLTQIHSLKDSNFQLTEALEKAVDRAEAFKERIAELERVISELQLSHEEAEKRYEGTVSQQTKLIDFLQAKSEAPAKKKTLADRLFGEKPQKENCTPVPLKYRDLEGLLERERMRNKQLNDQLNRARAEIVSLTNKGVPSCPDTPCLGGTPQSRRALRLLAQSPSVQSTPAPASRAPAAGSRSGSALPAATPTPQRMHHNIPHRFDTGLMTRAAKCAACLGPVRFGRTAARCAECHVTAHPKCAAELPRTCGLPAALARHFSDSWQQSDASPTMRRAAAAAPASAATGPPKPPRQQPETPIAGKGWIRVPRAGKTGWERRFLCVEDGRLTLYAEEPSPGGPAPPPLQTVDLRSGHVHVDADVAYSEVPQLARRDLPYVFKVGIVQETTCWPAKSYQFLCSSLPEKQQWVTLLESVVPAAAATDESRGGARAQLLYSAEGRDNIDINCAYMVTEQLMLLGTEDGLYSLALSDKTRPERRIKVDAFPPVLMMKQVPELDQLAFICGKEHELRVAPLNAVRACAEAVSATTARLETCRLEGLESCHLLSTGATADKQVYVCAASSNRVCTQEPATCLQFTATSIIIGTDRFFEVDLSNFAIEEFLDSSDASLAYIVYGTSQMRSFPVAILSVSEKEFLLCYHELGVFVDQFGARSRQQDIKWTRLPLAFAWQAPFLYIFHFNAVEVVEVARGSFRAADAVPPAVSQLQLNGARFLAATEAGVVVAAAPQPGAAQLHRLTVASEAVEDTTSVSSWADTDSAAVTESVTEPDGGDGGSLEFSFTPSVMESLDDGGGQSTAGTGDTLSIGSDLSSMSSGSQQPAPRQVRFNETVRVRQHLRPSADPPVPDSEPKRRRR
ncbi:Citron Rho-interacting kinase [Amphibalanus amphitrite]|uniref:non-specific serine/threonine protein kinase n=1 Tax=Amphibalanus amphitrite TaxID=1232801 RepID=A0A6A4WTC1_AMPAM|nr:Citron Rho-interacting kinase [Amphibalanus amphitrite]KAF0310046.1 Citron Rho-interacting kinase [Amphibalanus amphitrite]